MAAVQTAREKLVRFLESTRPKDSACRRCTRFRTSSNISAETWA